MWQPLKPPNHHADLAPMRARRAKKPPEPPERRIVHPARDLFLDLTLLNRQCQTLLDEHNSLGNDRDKRSRWTVRAFRLLDEPFSRYKAEPRGPEGEEGDARIVAKP